MFWKILMNPGSKLHFGTTNKLTVLESCFDVSEKSSVQGHAVTSVQRSGRRCVKEFRKHSFRCSNIKRSQAFLWEGIFIRYCGIHPMPPSPIEVYWGKIYPWDDVLQSPNAWSMGWFLCTVYHNKPRFHAFGCI